MELELERNGNGWGMANGKYEEWLPRGFDDGAFLDVFTSFGACLFSGLCRCLALSPAGGRLWNGDGLLLSLGKGGPWHSTLRILYYQKTCKAIFPCGPFSSGFSVGATAFHAGFEVNT
jgi:hypothetical protein